MNYIDIGQYYDIANSKFYSNQAKNSLRNVLKDEPLTQSFKTFKDILNDNSYLVDDKTLKKTKIVFNTKKRKRFLETKDLIKNLRKEKNSFDNNYSNAKKIIDDIIYRYQNEERIEGLLEELDHICKKIINDYNEQNIESNYGNKCSKKTFGSASSIRGKIAMWKERITGTFNEETNTITLYMLNICDSNRPNICLISTFAHELFHAFHFYAANNCFLTEWLDRDVAKFVKEGLARYAELAFLENIKKEFNYPDAKEHADTLKASLRNFDIKSDPYAAYKLYKDKKDFINIFNNSLIDIGHTYNLLVNMYYSTNAGTEHKHKIDNKSNKYERLKNVPLDE